MLTWNCNCLCTRLIVIIFFLFVMHSKSGASTSNNCQGPSHVLIRPWIAQLTKAILNVKYKQMRTWLQMCWNVTSRHSFLNEDKIVDMQLDRRVVIVDIFVYFVAFFSIKLTYEFLPVGLWEYSTDATLTSNRWNGIVCSIYNNNKRILYCYCSSVHYRWNDELTVQSRL